MTTTVIFWRQRVRNITCHYVVHDVQQQTVVFFSSGSFIYLFFNILPCTASHNRMINEPRNGKSKEVVAVEFYIRLTVDT
jgi:hypothetical protein